MSLASGLSDNPVMGDIYTAYGIYEMTKGQNVYAATEYFLKALGYARQLNDKTVLAGALSNLVSSMTNQQDTTGLRYALESYQLAKEAGDTLPQTFALVNLVMQNKFKKDYGEAAKWLQILRETAGPTFLAVTINTLQADLYRESNDYAKASQYIDLAIAMADTSHTLQPMERENAYLGKANILNKQGLYAESNQWLNRLEALSKQSQMSIPKAEMDNIYADNYEHLGNYQKALEYRDSQMKLKRENTNSNRIKIQKAKEIALDLSQKEDEIKRHQDNARMLKWVLGGVTGGSLLLIGICLYNNMYRNHRRLMSVVVERAQKEEKIEEGQEKLVDNKYVELFQRIKHEIEDNKMFLDANLSRESLSEHLNINRTYISEAISQMTGMRFPQYISSLRVAEAERRLHDLSVDVSNLTDFGRTLGFTSLSAFQTAFKRHTGMTLSAYREIARK
jgi:AraC-like DNA-binding protein